MLGAVRDPRTKAQKLVKKKAFIVKLQMFARGSNLW